MLNIEWSSTAENIYTIFFGVAVPVAFWRARWRRYKGSWSLLVLPDPWPNSTPGHISHPIKWLRISLHSHFLLTHAIKINLCLTSSIWKTCLSLCKPSLTVCAHVMRSWLQKIFVQRLCVPNDTLREIAKSCFTNPQLLPPATISCVSKSGFHLQHVWPSLPALLPFFNIA